MEHPARRRPRSLIGAQIAQPGPDIRRIVALAEGGKE